MSDLGCLRLFLDKQNYEYGDFQKNQSEERVQWSVPRTQFTLLGMTFGMGKEEKQQWNDSIWSIQMIDCCS